ncbi:MAG: hypothetical protein GX198_02620 [Epulopiscium sp.]|nr:hypothetical protein [Candidatus Epulonipiscium sp.]
MKKILIYTTFLSILFISLSQLKHKEDSNSISYDKPKLKEKILIVEIEDFNFNQLKNKGVYSFLHVYPRKNFKDLYFDLKRKQDVTLMNFNEYIKREYSSISPIIILEKVKINQFEQITNFKKDDTSLIIVNLEKQMNPLFIESDLNGILQSNFCKREGIIKYTELINIINNHLESGSLSVQNTKKANEKIQKIYYQYTSLYYGRYILITFILIQFTLFVFSKQNKILFQYFIFIPFFLSSVSGLNIFNSLNGIYKALIIILLSFIPGTILYYKKFDYKSSMLIIWYSNLLFLIYFSFSKIFLYQSPIGFNNILHGNRLYGWNNDLIGIFIGSLLGMIYINHIYPDKKLLYFLAAIFFIYIIIFSPLYGANIGGMLNCFISIIILTIFFELSNYKKFLYTIVFIAVFLIFQNYFIEFDNYQKYSTHLASFINLIENNEFQTVLIILCTKIKEILLFLIIPPLNILLFLEWLILFKNKNDNYYDKLWKNIFFLISLSVILLNDSGLLSAIFMLFYFVIPYTIKNNIRLI